MSKDGKKLVVVDAGARFGPHPSWKDLYNSGLALIHGFEPEIDEYNWLSTQYKDQDNYKINPYALGKDSNNLKLNIHKHKGQSSFFSPNLQSDWFREVRKKDAEQVSTQSDVQIITAEEYINNLALENNLIPRFIKSDTEGFDLYVIEGFGKYLESIHAIRTEINFQPIYIDSPKLQDLLDFLCLKDFRLANLDYKGSGIQQSYFVPHHREYGILAGTEAVFIRSHEYYLSLQDEDLCQVIAFFLCNKLEDYAISLLSSRETSLLSVKDTKLWDFIERKFLIATKKFEVYSTVLFEKGVNDFERFFFKPYPEMHKFYRYINS